VEFEVIDQAASSAKHSLAQVSISVKIRKRSPPASESPGKSIAERWFARIGASGAGRERATSLRRLLMPT